jgi:hypothetical protein
MTNPIPKSNMFVTPADFDHLTRLLNESGTKEEQRMAWYGAMLALNLAHDLIKNQFDVLVNKNTEPV